MHYTKGQGRFPVWKLATVFLDDGEEVEGHNIDSNLRLLLQAARSGAAHENHGHDDDDDVSLETVYDALVKSARTLRESTSSQQDDDLSGASKSASSATASRTQIDGISELRTTSTASSLPEKPQTQKGNAKARLVRKPAATKPSRTESVRSMLRGTSQLQALVRPSQRKNASQERCAHCKLCADDPPFFEVPCADGGRRQPGAPLMRYGNLPLGIFHPNMADEQLWLATAKLQIPSYVNITAEQCAFACKNHFVTSIGVPPWLEQLITSNREHRNRVRLQEEELNDFRERNLEIQNEISRIKKCIFLNRSLKNTNNPEEERNRLEDQLAVAKVELADRQWQVDEANKKNRRDKESIELQASLAMFRREEAQRLLASIGKLYSVLRHVDPQRLAQLHVPETLFEILRNLPSCEYGRSTRRMDTSIASNSKWLTQIQCKDCLFLASSSPYCMVTGLPHADQKQELPSPSEMPLVAPFSTESRVVLPDASQDATAARSVNRSHESENPLWVFDEGASSTSHRASSEGLDMDHHSASVSTSATPQTATLGLHPPLQTHRPKSNTRHSEENGHLFDPQPPSSQSPDQAASNRRRPQQQQQPPPVKREGKPKQQHAGTVHVSTTHGGEPTPSTLEERPLDNASFNPSTTFSTTSSSTPSTAQQPHMHPPLLVTPTQVAKEAFELCAQHTHAFLAACAGGDVVAMRSIIDTIDPNCATVPHSEILTKYPAVAAAIFETEERFHEWYYAILLDVPQLSSAATPGTGGSSNAASSPSVASSSGGGGDSSSEMVKQRIFRLRKELRELEHAFAKRPNTRKEGFTLDDEAFLALAGRLQELDKKIAQVRAKARLDPSGGLSKSITKTYTTAMTTGGTAAAGGGGASGSPVPQQMETASHSINAAPHPFQMPKELDVALLTTTPPPLPPPRVTAKHSSPQEANSSVRSPASKTHVFQSNFGVGAVPFVLDAGIK